VSGRLRCPSQVWGCCEALSTVVLVLVTVLPALPTVALVLGTVLPALLAVLVTVVPLRAPVDTRARSLERERWRRRARDEASGLAPGRQRLPRLLAVVAAQAQP
jgi:choline-glycine betaine transporter